MLICTDRSRRLPVHDRSDRELLIACGSFTIYTEIALQAAGLICDVEQLPEPSFAPDVVAALQVKPGAPGSPPDERAQALAAVMDRTEYDRRPFATAPVDDAHITSLHRAAEAEGAWLVVLDDDRRIEAAALHTRPTTSCVRIRTPWTSSSIGRDTATATPTACRSTASTRTATNGPAPSRCATSTSTPTSL